MNEWMNEWLFELQTLNPTFPNELKWSLIIEKKRDHFNSRPNKLK